MNDERLKERASEKKRREKKCEMPKTVAFEAINLRL